MLRRRANLSFNDGRTDRMARPSRAGVVLLVGLMLIGVQSDSRSAEETIRVGDRFPDLRSHGVEGEFPATLLGKVVVVDFWASWCGPCKESFSVLEELNLRFGKRGLVILAVNVDESRAAMAEFLKERPVSFNVVRDSNKDLVRAINIQSMPSSYVLDPAGKVHAIYQGFRSAETRRKFIHEVQQLLEAAAPKPIPGPRL